LPATIIVLCNFIGRGVERELGIGDWGHRHRHHRLHLHLHIHLPVVLAVVLVAAIILQLPPTLPVATGGDQDHVASVVQMEERVPRLRTNAVHVAAKMRENGVFSGGRSTEFKAIW